MSEVWCGEISTKPSVNVELCLLVNSKPSVGAVRYGVGYWLPTDFLIHYRALSIAHTPAPVRARVL